MKREQIIAQAILEFNMNSGNIQKELLKFGNKLADSINSLYSGGVSEKDINDAADRLIPHEPGSQYVYDGFMICAKWMKSHPTSEISEEKINAKKHFNNHGHSDKAWLDGERIIHLMESYHKAKSKGAKPTIEISEGEIESGIEEYKQRYRSTFTPYIILNGEKINLYPWGTKQQAEEEIRKFKWAISKGAKPMSKINRAETNKIIGWLKSKGFEKIELNSYANDLWNVVLEDNNIAIANSDGDANYLPGRSYYALVGYFHSIKELNKQ